MASRPRREDETFEEYRAALKSEDWDIKQRIRGTMKYIAKKFTSVPDPDAPVVKYMPPPMKTVAESFPPFKQNLAISRKTRRAARNQ